MAYTPTPNDPTQPLDTTDRSTAAAEFRAMKTLFSGMATVASSATPDIFNAPSQVINYTGTTLATGFVASLQAGMRRTLICAGAAQFTAGANLLIDGVASGTTITVGAGNLVNVFAITTTQFRMIMASDIGTIQGYVGEVRQGFWQAAPLGWALLGTVASTISRATYPILTAQLVAAGSPFGAGDGVTTIGMPYIPAGYTWLQAVSLATVGALTHGMVQSHTHTVFRGSSNAGSGGLADSVHLSDVSYTNPPAGSGVDNLAAGFGINYMIRMG